MTVFQSFLIAENLSVPLRCVRVVLSSNRTYRKTSWNLFLAIISLNIFLPYEFSQKLQNGSSRPLTTPRIILIARNAFSSSIESLKLLFPCRFASTTVYFWIFNREFLPRSSSKASVEVSTRLRIDLVAPPCTRTKVHSIPYRDAKALTSTNL